MSRNHDLSPRELQVLAHAAEGYCDKSISRIVGCAHQTVKGVMERILVKLDSRNRTEAAVKAVRAGLL